MVGNVDGGIYLLEVDKVPFNPLAESKVFDINMAGASSGLLCIALGGTTVVVLVSNSGSLLQDIQIPENAANEERHPVNVACSHEFCFSGGEHNGGLELCLVSNGAASKLYADAAERAPCFDSCGPVRVAVGHSNGSIVIGTAVEE
jgi:hypothetical protein